MTIKSQKNIYFSTKKNDIRCPPLLMPHTYQTVLCTYCSLYVIFPFVQNISIHGIKYIYHRFVHIFKVVLKNERIFSRARPFLKRVNSLETFFRNGGFIFLLYPSRSLCLSLRLYFCLMYVKILCFSWVVIAIYTNVYIK